MEEIYMAWIEAHTEEREGADGKWVWWIVLNEETEYGPYPSDTDPAFTQKVWDLADQNAIEELIP